MRIFDKGTNGHLDGMAGDMLLVLLQSAIIAWGCRKDTFGNDYSTTAWATSPRVVSARRKT